MKPKAYSYIRFSTPEQLKGDSLRRQLSAARAYAAEHDLDLDEETTFRDLGVSGFRGKNREEGALGAFIRAVDDGIVPRESYLLVENLDRLSRDKVMTAFKSFASLLERGITLVTLTDRQVFTQVTVNENMGQLFMSLGAMFRAHDESLQKSKRLGAAWKNKKKNAGSDHSPKLTAAAPSWLRLSEDRMSFDVIEESANVVRRIFKMSTEGIGRRSIVRTLNEEGVSPIGRAEMWHTSYIGKLLCGDAVIGVYHPHKYVIDEEGRRKRVPDGDPIEGYYPGIVDQETFYRAQGRRDKNKSGRQTDAGKNVLRGIAFCEQCGAPMYYVNKGANPTKGGQYLACSNALSKANSCDHHKHWSFERHLIGLLLLLPQFSWESLMPREAEQHSLQKESLLKHVEALQGRQEAVSTQVDNLVDLMSQTGSQALVAKLEALEAELNDITVAHKTARGQLSELDAKMRSTDTPLERIEAVNKVASEWVKGRDDQAWNRRLHKLLSSFFTKITFDPTAVVLESSRSKKTQISSYAHVKVGWTPEEPPTGHEKSIDEGTLRLHLVTGGDPLVAHVARYRGGRLYMKAD